VKEDLNLVANGRFQCLVTLGRLEGSIVWWAMEREGKSPFPLFPFSLNKFYLNLHFFH